DFINKLTKFFSNKKEDLITHKKFDELFAKAIKPHALQDAIALNYISVSKKFDTNSYGDFGLSHWEEIRPKTMRAKAYLVIRKHQKPMHFKKIAESINKAGFDKRMALPQTVHNELIKDTRFILVGRGIYGLKEFGLMPGTAREVIARLIKTKGPLSSSEVVNLTLEQRVLKKGTILLNLQNKKNFKRLPNGRYHLA
ncbi:MAG: winged helix-turn-helix domain-containing protein, partial [Candidatus Paceibacterota bacterium]